MRLGEYERRAARRLTEAGVDSPRLSIRILVCHGLRIDNVAHILAADRELTPQETACLDALTARRARGEPVAYITGRKEFYGRDFHVTRQTLIPRPETELLVDAALEAFADPTLLFADLGAGSGCIGVTLCLERPAWRGILVDASFPALSVARKNAEELGAAERTTLVQADMCATPGGSGIFDLVAANPPYIAPEDQGRVMDEVLRFEPRDALFSPGAGLAHLRCAVSAAARLLRADGAVIIEHGAAQGESVRELLRTTERFRNISTRKDLAGLERCTLARRL